MTALKPFSEFDIGSLSRLIAAADRENYSSDSTAELRRWFSRAKDRSERIESWRSFAWIRGASFSFRRRMALYVAYRAPTERSLAPYKATIVTFGRRHKYFMDEYPHGRLYMLESPMFPKVDDPVDIPIVWDLRDLRPICAHGTMAALGEL